MPIGSIASDVLKRHVDHLLDPAPSLDPDNTVGFWCGCLSLTDLSLSFAQFSQLLDCITEENEGNKRRNIFYLDFRDGELAAKIYDIILHYGNTLEAILTTFTHVRHCVFFYKTPYEGWALKKLIQSQIKKYDSKEQVPTPDEIQDYLRKKIEEYRQTYKRYFISTLNRDVKKTIQFIEENSLETLKNFIAHGLHLKQTDENGNDVLLLAVKKKNRNVVKKLFDACSPQKLFELIQCKDQFGYTVLWHAADKEIHSLIEWIFAICPPEKQASYLSQKNNAGNSILWWLITSESIRLHTFTFILQCCSKKYRADILKIRNKKDETLFQKMMLLKGHSDITRLCRADIHSLLGDFIKEKNPRHKELLRDFFTCSFSLSFGAPFINDTTCYTLMKMCPLEQRALLLTKQDEIGDTVLIKAVKEKRFDLLDTVIGHCPLNQRTELLLAKNFAGHTALMQCIIEENHNDPAMFIQNFLLMCTRQQRFQMIRQTDYYGNNTLSLAAQHTYSPCVLIELMKVCSSYQLRFLLCRTNNDGVSAYDNIKERFAGKMLLLDKIPGFFACRYYWFIELMRGRENIGVIEKVYDDFLKSGFNPHRKIKGKSSLEVLSERYPSPHSPFQQFLQKKKTTTAIIRTLLATNNNNTVRTVLETNPTYRIEDRSFSKFNILDILRKNLWSMKKDPASATMYKNTIERLENVQRFLLKSYVISH